MSALLAAGLAAGCDTGGRTPEPVPSPSPTSVPTGSSVPTDENCPPITGAVQTVTLPRGAAAPLPDGGQVQLQEVRPGADPSAVVLVTRRTRGCQGPIQLDFLEGATGSALGVKVEIVSVNASTGGMPPTVQLRIGPA